MSAIADLFGRIYVQSTHGLGEASYHFEVSGESYISYEAASAHKDWRLADGSMPPPKKHFIDARYSKLTRTFQGVVEWEPSLTGQVRWEYEMVFSKDFEWIESGKLKALGKDGKQQIFRFDGSLSYI